MFEIKDNTYNEIREKSVRQWLEEMSGHEDVAVRCGVKVTLEYLNHLKDEIQELKESNELKKMYLKKLKEKQRKN